MKRLGLERCDPLDGKLGSCIRREDLVRTVEIEVRCDVIEVYTCVSIESGQVQGR